MSLITVDNLTLGYDSYAVAENLSFEVNAGDYLCIIGENGSGKSTLMKTLLGLKKPLGGTVVFGDGVTSSDIGYLPQQSIVQRDFPASVKEIVLSGCKSSLFYTKEDKARAGAVMEELEISDLKDKCYRELSGGQQQRVLLARALLSARKIILLDEPVAGLDPVATREMYGVIKKLNNDGVTVIMISHDVTTALKYATSVLHMGDENEFMLKDEFLKSDIGRRIMEND